MTLLSVGIDEAGRGPIAGPVVAAAVVLNPESPIEGVTDSKKLSANQRTELSKTIKQHALAYGIGQAEVAEIDQLNILQASLLAMRRAFAEIDLAVDEAWVDGTVDPGLPIATHTLVKGDALRQDIGAASILAKVERDQQMCDYAVQYPEYGFEVHKGYPTKTHLSRLHEAGPCLIHRVSFKPVKSILASELFNNV